MKGGECGKQLPRFNIKKKIATSILLTLRRIFLSARGANGSFLKSGQVVSPVRISKSRLIRVYIERLENPGLIWISNAAHTAFVFQF
jgi:hypothetical protein